MPANLTPEYRDAEQQFRAARTPEERLASLRRMLSTVPKHKGTEKLQADIKRRIAKLNDQLEHQSRKKGFSVTVESEGAGQVVVVGPPNSGKSRLVAALTGVEIDSAPYPYSTQKPTPAMMPWEDVLVQLVDLPPVSSEHTEPWVSGIVRTADAALVVADLGSTDVLDLTEDCLSTLERRKIRLVGGEPHGDAHASVMEKRSMLVATRLDADGAGETLGIVRELYGDRFPVHAVSSVSGENVPGLREAIFRMLRVVRVYSKPPGRDADRTKPFVLSQGSTLLDFAKTVHHDFADQLKFARVWGQGKFDGQRANKDYPLADGDVIELHT